MSSDSYRDREPEHPSPRDLLSSQPSCNALHAMRAHACTQAGFGVEADPAPPRVMGAPFAADLHPGQCYAVLPGGQVTQITRETHTKPNFLQQQHLLQTLAPRAALPADLQDANFLSMHWAVFVRVEDGPTVGHLSVEPFLDNIWGPGSHAHAMHDAG
jgi:hypothetical protein